MDDLEQYRKHRDECKFKFAPMDVCLCTEKNMLGRIKELEARIAKADALAAAVGGNSDALVAAAYEDAADIFSCGDDIHRDDYPEWFVNRWEILSERTPAYARAALERVRQEARAEALREAESKCSLKSVEHWTDTTTIIPHEYTAEVIRRKILALITEDQTNG